MEDFCIFAASAVRLTMFWFSEGFMLERTEGLVSDSIRADRGFILSLLLISFSSFSDIGCFSDRIVLDLLLSRLLPWPLLFSLTLCVLPNNRLDLLVGRFTGDGVIMLACPSTCCGLTVLSGFCAMATLGAPGVEDRKGGMPGVEERDDLTLSTGGGAGEGGPGDGDKRTT